MSSNPLQHYFETRKLKLESHYPGINWQGFQEFYQTSRELFSLPESYIFSALEEGRPFAYIQKQSFFYQNYFFVDESVLIPRSETELLVEEALKEIKEQQISHVAEIGLGSGALLISVLLNSPHPLKAWGGDLSPQCIEVSKANLFRFEKQLNKHSVQFDVSDRFQKATGQFELILSNPPYIMKSEKDKVHPQVFENEPFSALFLEDGEYSDWYKEFFLQVKEFLSPGGLFIMEGSEYHLEELNDLIETQLFQRGEILKDLTGKKRFLKLRKNHG
jgi:release factor glutamine methyltransferase